MSSQNAPSWSALSRKSQRRSRDLTSPIPPFAMTALRNSIQSYQLHLQSLYCTTHLDRRYPGAVSSFANMATIQIQRTRNAETVTKTAIDQRQSLEVVQTMLHSSVGFAKRTKHFIN